MVESECIKREKGSALLIHPNYDGLVTGDWFDPLYWGSRAQMVGSGGRGAAWFIEAEGRRLVLREYRRGGLVAKLAEKSYVFTGEQNVRSFSEFRLLNWMVEAGLPVPRAVAAMYRKVSGLHYQASILIERIDHSVPLADLIRDLQASDWSRLGATIRRFHDAGVRHADLNCFNVLVKEAQFFLIDFDKGQLMPSSARPQWKQGNLERFARSLRKVAGETTQQKVWDSFLNGYNGSQSA